MRLNFTKMHGLGNDFIVFAANDALPSTRQLKALADRRTGIGFDQALAILPPRQTGSDLFYRIFNSDGSEVEQCGNGARCVAALVAHERNQPVLHMDCPGGRVNAELQPDGLVSIDMGIPDFTPAALPFIADAQQDQYLVDAGGHAVTIGAVSMGNPHAVLQVADVAQAQVAELGPVLESHARFPRRVNVGFMQVVDRSHIRLRVFERGVGETQACGTGACAAVAVGRKLGLLDESVRVQLPGGTLQIRWPGPGHSLWMTGPAVTVFTGHIDL